MVDLDEIILAKLAREMVMNIRNYQAVFADYGIDEQDYYEIEKNDFYKKAKETFAIEWNASISTEDRLKIGSLAYLEQLVPVITRRAMKDDANLVASTEVGKLLSKMAGVGEMKVEKNLAERFIININLGADTETYDKSIEITPNDVPPKPLPKMVKPKLTKKSKYAQVEAAKHGESNTEDP
jgi:hypothetical protein